MELESVILADAKGNSWEFAERVYEAVKEFGDNFVLSDVETSSFNDGEPHVHIPVNVRDRRCYFIHDSSKEPNRWLVEAILVNDALKRASAGVVLDVLPYMRFSRQERKTKAREPISAKAVVDVLSVSGADRFVTCDLHAPAVQGFSDGPFENLYSFPTAVEYFKRECAEFLENVRVVSPDVGGADRARAFGGRIGEEEIAIIDKGRPKPGEAEVYFVIGDVDGKNALMVDDMIDTGGSLIKGSKALKEAGAKRVWAYAAHPVFSNYAGRRLNRCESIEKVVVSDTIDGRRRRENIEVVSLAELFGEALVKIDRSDSVSGLFD